MDSVTMDQLFAFLPAYEKKKMNEDMVKYLIYV